MEKRRHPGDRGWHALASIETTSTFDELKAALATGAQPCGFEWVRAEIAPGATPLYELYVESGDGSTASCAGRSLLGELTDAADRGMLTGFRIVRGADLLLHHARKDSAPTLASDGAVEFDETSRAAQPDIATGSRRRPAA
jgi:hypothetical protein